jgi:hypothetical protein
VEYKRMPAAPRGSARQYLDRFLRAALRPEENLKGAP